MTNCTVYRVAGTNKVEFEYSSAAAFRFSSGMSLLTVIAMFTPNWSNLQLIGSAVTFIQVGIFRLWGSGLVC